MKDFLIVFEKPFMNYDKIIDTGAFEVVRSTEVRNKLMAVVSFDKTDIPLLCEFIDFSFDEMFYVFDRNNNVYELTKNSFELSDTITKKVNLIKDYERKIARYNKADEIRNREHEKYGVDGANRIVNNRPSLLFPKFRRCAFYCKADKFCCRFRLHIPPIKTEKHPLILFFDGAGSPGYDNTKQMFGFMSAWSRIKKSHPECCVIAPQLDKTQSYNSHAFSDMLWELVDTVSNEICAVDYSRIYLVGISYGAYGVIYEAFRHPDRYAAAVEAVGWYYYNSMMRNWDGGDYASDKYHFEFDDSGYYELAKTPFWLACSNIELEYTEALYNNLKKINADIKFTRNDKHGHSMYKKFYKEVPWDEWLFSKQKDIISDRSEDVLGKV